MAAVQGARAHVAAARSSSTSYVGTSSAAALPAAEKDRRDDEHAVTASPMRASEQQACKTPLNEPLGEVNGGRDFGADGDATFDLHLLPPVVPQNDADEADNGHIDLLVCNAADDTLSELVAAPPPRPSTMGFAILAAAVVYAAAAGNIISFRARAAPAGGKAAAARSNARASRSNAATSPLRSGCLDSWQRFLQNLAVRTLRLLGIFIALLIVLSQAASNEPMALVVIMCALVGILCVWWRGSAVSFGGACRAIREVVRWSWKGWVVVVVFVAVVPGVKGVDDYPNAAPKAACDVWAEGMTTITGRWQYYKWGCAKYISSGGTLTSCKAECARTYSNINVR
jgi:hypothetical protein